MRSWVAVLKALNELNPANADDLLYGTTTE